MQGLYGLGAEAPDVMLMAGIRFGLYTSHGTGKLIPQETRVFRIDPDTRQLGRLQKVDLVSSPISAPRLMRWPRLPNLSRRPW